MNTQENTTQENTGQDPQNNEKTPEEQMGKDFEILFRFLWGKISAVALILFHLFLKVSFWLIRNIFFWYFNLIAFFLLAVIFYVSPITIIIPLLLGGLGWLFRNKLPAEVLERSNNIRKRFIPNFRAAWAEGREIRERGIGSLVHSREPLNDFVKAYLAVYYAVYRGIKGSA